MQIEMLDEEDISAQDAAGAAEKMKMKKSKTLKGKDAAKTRAARAGLVFPVARIHNKLKAMVPAHCRVGGTAAVFMAAVLEYLVAELCELAGKRAKNPKAQRSVAAIEDASSVLVRGGKKKKSRISPRFLQFAIKEDPEFADLLSRVTLSGGGVVPLSDKILKEQLGANKRKAVMEAAVADDMGLLEE